MSITTIVNLPVQTAIADQRKTLHSLLLPLWRLGFAFFRKFFDTIAFSDIIEIVEIAIEFQKLEKPGTWRGSEFRFGSSFT